MAAETVAATRSSVMPTFMVGASSGVDDRLASSLVVHGRAVVISMVLALVVGTTCVSVLPRTWTASLPVAAFGGRGVAVADSLREALLASPAGQAGDQAAVWVEEGAGPGDARIVGIASDRTTAEASVRTVARRFVALRPKLPRPTLLSPPPPIASQPPPSHQAERDALAAKDRVLASEIQRLSAERLDAERTGPADEARSDTAALAARVAQAEAKVRELGVRYGPQYPAMIKAEEDLADARASLAVATEQGAAARAANAAAVAARVAVIDQALAQARADDAAVKQSENELASADRAAARTARQAEAALLRSPTPDRPPPGPRVLLGTLTSSAAPILPTFAATWIVLGAAAIVGLVVLRILDRRDAGFRTAAAAERALALSVFTVMPEMVRAGQGPWRFAAEGSRSHAARAYRQTIANLGARPGAVAICSALPAEGKTTVTIALARTAAAAGWRVLLVDCDGRMRAMSKRLVPGGASAGLVELLTGSATLADVLLHDPASPACVIPLSAPEQTGSELLGSPEKMKRLLSALKSRFDMVLLDTAPVLALAETAELAQLADSVLLVARWRRTPVDATRLALGRLSDARAKVSGLLLTRARFRRQGGGPRLRPGTRVAVP